MHGHPLAEKGRIGELDALRGFALLGVFVVHFVGINYWEMPMDDSVRDAWHESVVQGGVGFASDFLFYDKANTLFATLFGMGFWVMLTRLRERGANFERVYLRRLTVLFVMGLINWVFVFPWDVLHDYAIAGLVLFLMRDLSKRSMLMIGLVLTIVSAPVATHVLLELIPEGGRDAPATYHDESYLTWVGFNLKTGLQRDFVEGVYFAWLPYVLGRFLLGAWVIRSGWLEANPARDRVIKRLFIVGVVVGLLSSA
ncbi:MAG: heparan-alpha-glucosaminide N-acetyltransferase domain-containing protein [Pseudomonadota bacterium]